MPPPKPPALQADFDAAISTNVEDFDMDRAEAVVAALEELKLQGKDISNIITAGEEEVARHPASIASLALAQALLSSSSSSPDVAGAARAARDLSAALAKGKEDEDAETPAPPNDTAGSEAALKIAVAAGAVSSISRALTLFEKSPSELLLRTNKRDIDALLRCLARLCSSCDVGRDAAAAAGVPAKLCDLLLLVRRESKSSSGEKDAKDDSNEPDLVDALASTAAATATAHEGNKCALVDCGFGAAAAAALRSSSPSSSTSSSFSSVAVSPAAVRSLSAALCSLATADDPRPAASRAFQNGRTLGGEGVPAACLVAFRGAITEAKKGSKEASESWMDTAASAAMAARRSVVNDELCREFADAGGAAAVLRALLLPTAEEEEDKNGSAATSSTSQPLHHIKLARSCCSLLRQLAGSDSLKTLIIDEGGFELVTRVVAAHRGRHSVAEQALGLLVALTLRNPDACTAAVEAGCVRAAADVLRSSGAGVGVAGSGPCSSSSKEEEDEDENAAPVPSSSASNNSDQGNASSAAAPSFTRNPHQWAQRQACAAIRNVVSRSLELRPAVLSPEQGNVEPLLRAARDRYPEACGDVGAAALRDLGCDDYDGKKQAKKKNEIEGKGKGGEAAASAAAAAARAEADGRFGVAV